MRLAVIVGSVMSLSALLVLGACADQTSSSDTPTDDDAGTPPKKKGSSSSSSSTSSSGSSGDPTGDGGTSSSSSSSGGTKPAGSQLANQPVILWGVTADGMVVYQPLPAQQGQTTSLEAIPLVGGAKTTIVPTLADTDVVSVSGGAVAYWTNVAGGLGTFNVWTKANGAKTAVATGSLPDLFAASKDGSRIAFSVSGTVNATDPNNIVPTGTALAVTGSATPSATPLKASNTTITFDLDQQACPPDLGFAGNVFLAGGCPASANTTLPTLYMVGATATAFTRLDGTGTSRVTAMEDGTFWSADDTGAKVLALINATTKVPTVFTTASPANGLALDAAGGAVEGLLLKDGSAAVYRNATTLNRATTAATPVKTVLLANGTTPKAIQLLSPDGNRVVFNTMDPPAQGAPLIDLRVIDTTSATQAPIDIVATGTGYPLGFTADSAHILYYTDVGASGVTLKTKTPVGTSETTLATNIVAARPAQAGTGVLIRTNKQTDQNTGLTTYDLQSIDAAAGGMPKSLAKMVPAGLYDISGSKLVYVTFDPANPGLYVTDLP